MLIASAHAELIPCARTRTGWALVHSPSLKRARGTPDAPIASAAPCAKVKSTRVSSPRSHRTSSGVPHTMVGTASFALSPVDGFLATVLDRERCPPPRGRRTLPILSTSASRRRDHATSVVRLQRRRRSRCFSQPRTELRKRPPHPAPRTVTIAIRPSHRDETKELNPRSRILSRVDPLGVILRCNARSAEPRRMIASPPSPAHLGFTPDEANKDASWAANLLRLAFARTSG